MDREFKREYLEDELPWVAEVTKIGIFSFTKGSGTTFVATSLAKYIASEMKKPVAFIELTHNGSHEPLLYEALGMDQRFSSRTFISFFAEIQDHKYIKRLKNTDAGINWAIRTPKDRENQVCLTSLEEIRLLNNICGDFIVCDLGSEFYAESMEEMDALVGVIDPLPSKLMAAKKLFHQIRLEELGGRRIFWVVNKNNHGVNNRLLKRFLKLKNPITIPLIPEEWFYVAQYHCRLPFEQSEIKKETRMQIEELVNHHILFT